MSGRTYLLISPRHSRYDLTMAIRTLVWKSPIKQTISHLKGHQDEDPYRVLDRWAKLNVQVDILVKAYWAETRDIPLNQHEQRIRGEGWTILMGKRKVCSRLKDTLYEYEHRPKMMARWEK